MSATKDSGTARTGHAMSYDPERLWSELEDNAVREFYARHGPKWVGWPEVLPNRTPRAISARATRLGVKGPPRPEPKHPREVEPNIKRRSHRATKAPDPYEGYVMNCMCDGMTTSQIDQHMHWRTGTAALIITERWERENEQ